MAKVEAIELYNGEFIAPIIRLNSSSITTIKRELHKKLKESTFILRHTPVVLAFTERLEKIDLNALKELFNANQVYLLGVVDWHNNLQKELINTIGLPALHRTTTPEIPLPEYRYRPPKIVQGNVTDKQSIYAKNSDLIIQGDVEAGAEVIADGNIHIYGKLYGRAMAGVNNTVPCSIYVQYFDPEFIAVNQRFMYKKEIDQRYLLHPLRIEAEKNTLLFTPF